MEKIELKEAPVEEAMKVDATIVEFGKPFTKEKCEQKYKKRKKLILIAYLNNKRAGYIIAYDKYRDGSLYCWMAGVNPKFRKKGILKKMMEYQYSWAKKSGFNKIRIKTRNSRREMLGFLVKYGFNFRHVIPFDSIVENQISLEKKL